MALGKRGKTRGGHAGFTLVELIVVIAILAVVLSASVAGIASYQEWAAFKRQNEYAQTLFVAAQTQLTRYSERGQVKTLEAVVEQQTVDLGALTGADGQPAAPEDIWDSDSAVYRGTVHYLMGTAADYDAYLAGAASPEVTALYDLFDAYVYDKSVLRAAICVEFDPAEGLVYSVLYSDRNDGFTYAAAGAGEASIRDRTEAARREQMVGYYGVDTLSKSTSTKTEKPVISGVMLNNEETLNLTYRLSKAPAATTQLTYEIAVHDATNKNTILSILLDGSKLVSGSSHTSALTADCTVLRYGDASAAQELGTYTFPAYVDENLTVHLILDAADLGATVSRYQALLGGDLSAMRESFSFHRFGLEAENLYCTVQGSGGGYKTTAKKQSNTSFAYFGKVAQEAGGQETRTLLNARHLYNVRFTECDPDAPAAAYTVGADFGWDALIAAGAVYRDRTALSGRLSDSDLKVSLSDPFAARAFPSIAELRAGSALQSAQQSRPHSISGLALSDTANANAGVSGGSKGATGLFLVNRGAIQNVILDNIVVQGSSQVGAFCGVNYGTLTDLTVENTGGGSSVTGLEYVGGIVGMNGADGSVTYSDLTNRAAVTGLQNVGGIIGRIETNWRSTAVIRDCVNYGRVLGVPSDGWEPNRIGGIVGCAENSALRADSLVIRDCVSSSQYTEEELAALLADPDGNLRGIYVGGIVGLNYRSSLTGCSTVGESGREGYVVGGKYVGGIAGLNVGLQTSMDGGGQGRNQANVIGRSYVGGITGANATVNLLATESDGSYPLIPEVDTTKRITGWVNEGLVIATERYAGGIVGLNAGAVEDCRSDVDNDAASAALVRALGGRGDYAGGIAGCNRGEITSGGETIPVVSVVTGRNYVGGVAGLNDTDGVIRGYALQGGYLTGGTFVGGFVGLNLNADLLTDNSQLTAAPNQVSGRFCVGGVLGGNIIRTNADIETAYQVDNFLGSIRADAFAGGFIGYNLLLQNGSGADIAAGIAANLSGDYAASADYLAGLSAHRSKRVLTISGTSVNFSGITADVYAGGVIGYQDFGSYLYIKDVTNCTPITANSYITQGGHDFSFAGGILGRVSDHVVLERCRNAGAGVVRTRGDYTGGLTELNEGLIVDCTAGSLGDRDTSLVGGISGLNLASGSADFGNGAFVKDHLPERVQNSPNSIRLGIYGCTLEGTITGRDTVGGITAENIGTVHAPLLIGSVVGYGEGVGGVTGRNYAGGMVELEATLSAGISGSGKAVGGVVGISEGEIRALPGSPAAALATAREMSVSGRESVGGVIGRLQNTESLSGLTNGAAVTATGGNAGGIVGSVSPLEGMRPRITGCINRGPVQATEAGSAGGITAENGGACTISQCVNFAEVTAANGAAGGIVGVNAGALEQCAVLPEQQTAPTGGQVWSWFTALTSFDGQLAMSGLEFVGGVTGVNRESGTMRDCAVANLTVTDLARSSASRVGGLAGVNEGEITLSGAVVRGDTAVRTCVSGGAAGGIAGFNAETGAVSGAADVGIAAVRIKIEFSGSAGSYASFGGAVGVNEGSVQDIDVYADIRGNKGTDDTGYGGVAGVNSGAVTGCSYSGALYADGTVSEIVSLGGIAGRNLPGGIVRACHTGTGAATTVTSGESASAFGYVGGTVGWNQGSVQDCDNAANSRYAVEVVGYAGHIGGIVGFNDSGALVTGSAGAVTSTGRNWVVEAKWYSNNCGTGGIMGYSASGKSFSWVQNYADVYNSSGGGSSNTAVGGIIGRFENAESLSFTMYACENHGDIWGNLLAGGFVGRWKYNGGSLERCVNYGDVGIVPAGRAGSAATHAAGLIATTYEITSGYAISLRGCENHGAVYGRTASAGIVGHAQSSASYQLVISDCVNTGVIDGNGSAVAGILAGKQNCTAELYRCRNYGLATSRAQARFAGISTATPNTAQYCFDFSNAGSFPLLSGGAALNSFYVGNSYFAGGSVTEDAVFLSGADKGAAQEDATDPLTATFDGDTGTRCCVYHGNKAALNGSNPIALTYNLAEATDLQGWGVRWCNNGTDQNSNVCRQYVYTLEYSADNGATWTEVTSADSADAANQRATYNADLGRYVEVGYPAKLGEAPSTYYHDFGADGAAGVTNVRVTVYQILSANTLPAAHRDGVVWSGGGISNNAYLNLYDVYAVRAGQRFDPIGSLCSYTGTGALSVRRNVGGGYSLVTGSGSAIVADLARDPLGKGPGTTAGGSAAADLAFRTDFSNYQNYKGGNLGALTSYRYQLVGEIEPRLVQYYMGQMGHAEAPENVAVTDVGGAYRVSWTHGGAYYYEVAYTVADADGSVVDQGSFTTYEKYKIIDVKGEWAGKTMTVSVRAQYWRYNAATGIFDLAYTDWAQAAPFVVKATLPTPSVHLELIGTGQNCFRVVLDNRDDYESVPDSVIRFYTGNTLKCSFRAGDGASAPIAVGTSANTANYTLAAQAEPAAADSVNAPSLKRAAQTFVFNAYNLKQTDYAVTYFDGFYGDTMAGLYYTMRLDKASANTETYYYAELVAYDDEVGADVAFSYGESHVTGMGQQMTATLSQLPADLLRSNSTVTLRTYPWRTQGYMTYFGHVVGEHLTAEQVKALADGGSSIWSGGALREGYVVQKNTDGSYRVLYSSILGNADVFPKQIDAAEYAVDLDALAVRYGGASTPVRPAPVIDSAYGMATETGSEVYTFHWDQGKGERDAVYHVTLIGLADSGAEVELAAITTTGANYSAETRGWGVSLTEDNWNYANLELRVERVGAAGAGGRTTVFPLDAVETFNVKQRLSAISAPTMSLHQSGGVTDKDNLLYDISWTGLANSAELRELLCYEVTVYGRSGGLLRTFRTDDADIAAAHDATALLADLNDYTGGEVLEVSVKAIARDDAATYRNGAKGVVLEFTLPTRLAAPEMDPAKAGAGYGLTASLDDSAVVSISDFESRGVTLTMAAPPAADRGKYELVLEIYDGVDGALLRSVTTKAAPATMAGSLERGTYALTGLSADYAGMYLKVVMRSVSDSNVSSVWTDSVSGGGMTPAMWLRLPRVQADTPALMEGAVRTDTDLDATGLEYVEQNTIAFDAVDYAGGYDLTLVRTLADVDLDADLDYRRADVDWLRGVYTADHYAVYYQSTADTRYESAQLLGELYPGGSLALPYAVTATDPETGLYTVTIAARLALSDGGRLTLVLPDSDSLYGGEAHYTQNVTVQAIAADPGRYANSALATWQRATVDGQPGTVTGTIPAGPAAPALTAPVSIAVSDREGAAFELTAAAPYRLVLELSCGGRTQVIAMPGYGVGSIQSLALLPAADYAGLAGQTATMRVCAVVPGSGVSRWSEPVSAVLPALP